MSDGKDVEKGNLVPYWWGCKWVQSLWKTVWSFLKKLKIEFIYDLDVLFLGTYQKEMKTGLKETSDFLLTEALFTIAKI